MEIAVFVSRLAYFLIFLFQIALWGNLVLNLIRNLNPAWRPTGPLLLIADVIFRITDPVLDRVRKVIPPLSLGAIRLDLAWMILMFGTIIANNIILSIPRILFG